MPSYRVYILKKDPRFPEPMEHKVHPMGLLAMGGDLSTERLLNAYSLGIFPWSDYRQDFPEWFCPTERFVIFPDKIHISHSMRNLMNKDRYRVTYDTDFEGVIKNCSQLRIQEEGSWLGPKMIEAYTKLHQLGYAHSVEVWEEDRLVGGLYGVKKGKGFFGESMFSLVPSASKLALIALAQKCKEDGINLIDCQLETPHLKSMGGEFIPYKRYRELIFDGEEPDTINQEEEFIPYMNVES